MNADPSARLNVQIPPEVANGVFADFVAVWHTAYGFTLDFGVMGLATKNEQGNSVIPTPVVARVKIPPGLIFQVARAIADNVDKYEKTFGPITPRPPDTDGLPGSGPTR